MSKAKFVDKYKGLLSSDKHDWGTPQWLYDQLNDEFNFTVDVCASHYNSKHPRHYTKDDDGLHQSWRDEVAWMNPPYGHEVGKWVKKAYESALYDNATVVCLLRASATSTLWFRDYASKGELRFIDHRLKFEDIERRASGDTAPFSSMIVIFTRKQILKGPHAKLIHKPGR